MAVNIVVILLLIPTLSYWISATIYYLISKCDFSSRYKINTKTIDSENNKVKPHNVLIYVLGQHIAQIFFGYVLSFFTDNQIHFNIYSVLKIIVGILMTDTYNYWVHKLFHYNNYLYKKIHYVHHKIIDTYSFAALYNHPFESFVMDFVGAGIPSIILNMCPLTQCIFFTLLSLKTVSDHSGMFLPYDPFVLFKNNSRYHDIHHKIKNIKFNLEQPYFSFWDTIMSTEKNNPQSPQ